MRFRICLILALASAAMGQQFEVASIRPSGPNSPLGWEGGPGHKDPTRYTYGQATMMSLIYTAWGIQPFQISSPMPLDRDKFDVIAKVPEGATKAQFQIMLQNLLAERFGLKVHMTSKEFPAYELVMAKGGTKLKEGVALESAIGERSGWPDFPAGVSRLASNMSAVGPYALVRLKSQLEPIATFADSIHPADRLPVVDRTGLAGNYSFALEYSLEPMGGMPDTVPPAPSLFTALQQQLGLQLTAKKLPFDVVVVESFNRTPTEN